MQCGAQAQPHARVELQGRRDARSQLQSTATTGVCQQVGAPAGVQLEDVFTTDPSASPIHVMPWGFLGESWPFFRPNFVNMEQMRAEQAADEVCSSRMLEPATAAATVLLLATGPGTQLARHGRWAAAAG